MAERTKPRARAAAERLETRLAARFRVVAGPHVQAPARTVWLGDLRSALLLPGESTEDLAFDPDGSSDELHAGLCSLPWVTRRRLLSIDYESYDAPYALELLTIDGGGTYVVKGYDTFSDGVVLARLSGDVRVAVGNFVRLWLGSKGRQFRVGDFFPALASTGCWPEFLISRALVPMDELREALWCWLGRDTTWESFDDLATLVEEDAVRILGGGVRIWHSSLPPRSVPTAVRKALSREGFPDSFDVTVLERRRQLFQYYLMLAVRPFGAERRRTS